MRLLNTVRLGLVLITIFVTLAAATHARADQVPLTPLSNSPVTTDTTRQPEAQGTLPSDTGTGSQPTAPTATDPAGTLSYGANGRVPLSKTPAALAA